MLLSISLYITTNQGVVKKQTTIQPSVCYREYQSVVVKFYPIETSSNVHLYLKHRHISDKKYRWIKHGSSMLSSK
jgi:hypothetical protein